jgi:hypothetical protein
MKKKIDKSATPVPKARKRLDTRRIAIGVCAALDGTDYASAERQYNLKRMKEQIKEKPHGKRFVDWHEAVHDSLAEALGQPHGNAHKQVISRQIMTTVRKFLARVGGNPNG